MLAKIEFYLENPEFMSFKMSSYFHGYLLTSIEKEYSKKLHEMQLNPFSQYLEKRSNGWYWIVMTFNQEAYQKIIEDFLMKVDKINILKINKTLEVKDKKIFLKKKELLKETFYRDDSDRYIELYFVTPTTFKKNQKYIFYPDLRCIFQSLMNKYDSSNDNESHIDEELLFSLTNNTEIVDYDLRTCNFYIEGNRIKGFIGSLKMKLSRTLTIRNYSYVLFEFAEYSGIGAKTALGMGGVKIIERKGL